MVQELNRQWQCWCSFIDSTGQGLEYQTKKDLLFILGWNLFLKILSQLDSLWLGLFQPQAIDSYITSDVYFPSWLELFQATKQDLFSSREPTEGDWESIHAIDFTEKTLLGLGDLMRKTQVRNSELRLAKTTVDVKRKRSKRKGGGHAVTSLVQDELLYPFLESAWNYLQFVCDGVFVNAMWKSDLVEGLGCFYYAVIFHLPKDQAAACFRSFLQGFSVRGWVLKKLRSIHNEETLHFVEDVRFKFLDDDLVGPEFEDMFSFSSGYPELCRKSKNLTMFCLSCFCLQLMVFDLPELYFVSPNSVSDGPDLSEIIRPVQGYFLCGNLDSNLFTDASSITECLEVLDFRWDCCGTGLQTLVLCWFCR